MRRGDHGPLRCMHCCVGKAHQASFPSVWIVGNIWHAADVKRGAGGALKCQEPLEFLTHTVVDRVARNVIDLDVIGALRNELHTFEAHCIKFRQGDRIQDIVRTIVQHNR